MIELARPRYGHFDLGTGYHGDVWLDLDALFLRPSVLRPHVRVLSDQLREHRVDAVCGPMEGGAFLAYALAELMGVAFLPVARSRGGAGRGRGPAGGRPGQSDHPGGAIGAVPCSRLGAEPGVAARGLPAVRRRLAADGSRLRKAERRPRRLASRDGLGREWRS